MAKDVTTIKPNLGGGDGAARHRFEARDVIAVVALGGGGKGGHNEAGSTDCVLHLALRPMAC